jgi:hypothetical protein
MLILFDTGIPLRLLEVTDPHQGTIRVAVRILHGRGGILFTAAQNVAELWKVCTRPATAPCELSRGTWGFSAQLEPLVPGIVSVRLHGAPIEGSATKGWGSAMRFLSIPLIIKRCEAEWTQLER